MNEEKKSKIPKYVRVLALLLFLLFVGELLLSSLANVDYSVEPYEKKTPDMAEYIARTDEYINEGFFYRVRNAVYALGTPETFEETYMCASVAIADNDLPKAAEYLQTCIDMFDGEDPLLAALNVKLGCILSMEDKWKPARKAFEDAVRLDDSNADAWVMLSEAAYQNEEYESAAEAMQMYSGLGGEMLYAHYSLLASAQYLCENYADAIEAFDTMLGFEECAAAETLFMRCKANYFLGNYPACREDAQKALDAGFDYSECMNMKAASYEGEGNYAGVLSVLMQMIDDGVEDGTVYQNALTCANEVDDYAAQEKILLRLLEYETDADTDFMLRSSLAMAQLQLSKFDEALATLALCMEAQPDNFELVYLRGVCYLNQQKYYDAYHDFTAAIEADTLVDESYYNCALCRLGLGQEPIAIQAELNEILERGTNEEMVAMAENFFTSQ